MAKPTTSNTKEKPSKAEELPAAGPHAKPSLVDDEKTPGSGALPAESGKDVDPGVG